MEGLALNPQNGDQLLIGYSRGLVVSCSLAGDSHYVDAAFHGDGVTIQSLSAHRDGKQFVTGHENGSYVYWHLHVRFARVNSCFFCESIACVFDALTMTGNKLK